MTGVETFRRKILELVGEEAKNVSKLARMAKVSRTTIYDIRDGKYGPSLATAEKIANAVGSTLSQMTRTPDERDEHGVDECFRRVVRAWNDTRKMKLK